MYLSTYMIIYMFIIIYKWFVSLTKKNEDQQKKQNKTTKNSSTKTVVLSTKRGKKE